MIPVPHPEWFAQRGNGQLALPEPLMPAAVAATEKSSPRKLGGNRMPGAQLWAKWIIRDIRGCHSAMIPLEFR